MGSLYRHNVSYSIFFICFTEIMNDTELAEVIMALNDPREIRESGKEVKKFSQQLWDDCCEAIVEAGNIEKVL